MEELYFGVVEDNKDPDRKGRIKVRVQTLYHCIPLEDIPYAHPIAGLAGKDFQIPAIGKIVNILFFGDDIYHPYYIYSGNNNENLQNKLKNISDEDYPDFRSLLFDESTQIYIEGKTLTIDQLLNKITIDNSSINHELKDNSQILNLGSKEADQDAVLGTRFFDWMDKFIHELQKPTSLIETAPSGLMAVQKSPALKSILNMYDSWRENFVSKNVKIVDNNEVKTLQRIPETVNNKDDINFTEQPLIFPPEEKDCSSELIPGSSTDNNEILNAALKSQNKKACEELTAATPTNHVPIPDLVKPVDGSLTSIYSEKRKHPIFGNIRAHHGVDIGAPSGTPVLSPADGIVEKSDYAGSCGNRIIIKHTTVDLKTGYCHLSKRFVNEKDFVEKGEVIGLVGSTGDSTGSHLHLTMNTSKGNPLNPVNYFTWNDPKNLLAQNSLSSNQYQGQNYQAQNDPCAKLKAKPLPVPSSPMEENLAGNCSDAPEAAKKSLNFFISKGWTKEQAAGIVGNIQQESNFDPNAYGDNGQAYGLAQWHLDRQLNFTKIFKNKSIINSSFEEQLAFIDWELKNTYAGVGNELKKVKTTKEATLIINKDYEVSADVGHAASGLVYAQKEQNRINYANNVYQC